MSLRPEPIGEVPAEIIRVARSACPNGTVVTPSCDKFNAPYEDEDFRESFPKQGQAGLHHGDWPWSQCFSFSSTSATARPPTPCARLDWKCAPGLELTDPAFHFSGLAEFRARLAAGGWNI